MTVMIDNYDSFTYNLVQYLGVIGARVRVFRNDATTVEAIARLQPDQIIVSPGPSWPEKAGISIPLIKRLGGRCPLLGVCLGHQCIAAAFGGRVVHAKRIMHGKTSKVSYKKDPLFEGLSNPFEAGRYHSLAVERASLPGTLEVVAEADDGEVMAIRHKRLPLWGVQFHPESVLTPEGKQLLKNFLEASRRVSGAA